MHLGFGVVSPDFAHIGISKLPPAVVWEINEINPCKASSVMPGIC